MSFENHDYLWKGINNKGIRVKGKITATNMAMIKTELEKQGILLIEIRKIPKSIFRFNQRIKTNDIVILSRHLATLIGVGISLVPALDMIKSASNKICVQQLIQAIKIDISSGFVFHQSLQRHPKYFNKLFCQLVKAGEYSGTLATMLKRLADHLEKNQSLKKKIRATLYYPIMVFSITGIAATLLLIFIVPRFEQLFRSFGAHLPIFTQIIINIAHQFRSKCVEFVICFFSSIGIFHFMYKRVISFKYRVDQMLLLVPLFGNLLQKTLITRMTQTLATILSAKMPLLDALSVISSLTNNEVYTRAILQMREEIVTGQSMQIAMKQTDIFPPLLIQMVAIGEESGSLDKMLDKIAHIYELEVDNTVNTLSVLLEPVVMLFLSLIIGCFILAMYLPIFKLSSIV